MKNNKLWPVSNKKMKNTLKNKKLQKTNYNLVLDDKNCYYENPYQKIHEKQQNMQPMFAQKMKTTDTIQRLAKTQN